MKKKFQHLVGRFKTASQKNQKRAAPLQKPSPAVSKTQAADDWDMSPQDALQVGIVARYK
ncbi:hypothetical protein RE428_19390 [Marinobacter nanhaiticus D15-8W]|uniref:Uncharacterized protein n=1 Tax=Marinobacter nanhaiticus D15-8W TaxID=626887 RepID=A0A371CG60_9GAMM|nr:hypothetical protein [Marinobacter nanhaiticus]RDW95420.1 hypothetical protein J057_24535 [Marinobacter nanhaiticus D15-8W]BES70921.1 hypothetical protein RE428_19390 [Marinobacter nanhaiticus D15-8W]